MNEQTSVEDFLMPGHVWTHVAKGTEATVLFVTNNHLSEKLLESYPSHVVYLDAKGNLTSATVAQFTKTRGFSHVEPAVESAIESLVATINQDDNITLEAEDSDSAAPTNSTTSSADEVTAEQSVSLELETSTNEAIPVVTSEALNAALISFNSVPVVGVGVMHHLTFKLSENLTNENVCTAFSSDVVRYSAFNVLVNGKSQVEVSWDEFHGVYPSIDNHGTYGTAVFLERDAVEEDLKKAPAKAAAKPAAKAAPKTAAKAKPTPEAGDAPAGEQAGATETK